MRSERSFAARITLPCSAAAPAAARRSFRTAVEQQLDPDQFAVGLLLVSELVTNAVEYSRQDRIELRIRVDSGAVRVEVAGDVENMADGLRGRPRVPDEAGLYPLERISRQLETSGQGTAVWFQL
jgi:anti-sigma regulatory factor (Ser/Thr protein kinase)